MVFFAVGDKIPASEGPRDDGSWTDCWFCSNGGGIPRQRRLPNTSDRPSQTRQRRRILGQSYKDVMRIRINLHERNLGQMFQRVFVFSQMFSNCDFFCIYRDIEMFNSLIFPFSYGKSHILHLHLANAIIFVGYILFF